MITGVISETTYHGIQDIAGFGPYSIVLFLFIPMQLQKFLENSEIL